tara:strand:- start:12093 stop:13193 length:1101 start_codon:yes stop_codon:yes gene_type:complete
MDYNASAPIHQDVLDFIVDSYRFIGNPSSVHTSGRKARSLIEDARENIGRVIDCNAQDVVFTSGATESNAMAFKLINDHKVIISSIEHPSIINQYNDANLISVSKEGLISIDHLEDILVNFGNTKKFVSVMAVNNETGVIQPIEKVSRICKKYGAILHVDAVQAIGKIPISMKKLNIDLLTISSHKIGGPKGVGCLIIKESIKNNINPIIIGGGQERGLRAGTEAVAQIAGFGKAIQISSNMLINETVYSRNELEENIKNNISNVVIIGEKSPRVANTSLLSIKGVSAKKLVMALDLEGYEVSSGSACSSGKVSDSHVLIAMGLDKSIVQGAIRISLCKPLSKKVIIQFSEILSNIVYRLLNYENK